MNLRQCNGRDIEPKKREKANQEITPKGFKQTDLDVVFDVQKTVMPNMQALSNQVARAETMLCLMQAEHNIAYTKMEAMIETIKCLDPNSQVLQKVSMSKKKLRYVSNHGIGFYLFSN